MSVIKFNLKTVEGRRAYNRAKYIANRKRHSAQMKLWRKRNFKKVKVLANSYYANNTAQIRLRMRLRNAKNKAEVLSHYGPGGKLQCSWDKCKVVDPDMLSLDHIKNDGAESRRSGESVNAYGYVRKHNYPSGYQTLCHNHQWKKELIRRRAM